MSAHMRARTTNGTVKFTVSVPLDKAGLFRKGLRTMLELAGLERETNEEGEELYEHEDLCPPEERPASRLRGLRAREGITQQQLADALGTTQSRVAELENGTRRISINMAKRLSKTYGVHYKVFL